MAYPPRTWSTGDTITAVLLNAIENGLAATATDADDAPLIIDRIVATTTISNNDTEQTLYTKSVTGGILGTGGALLFKAWGDAINNTGGTQSTIVRLKLGTTTIGAVTMSSTTSATRRNWKIEAQINNVNASSQSKEVRLSIK